jgi:hypothetical protein
MQQLLPDPPYSLQYYSAPYACGSRNVQAVGVEIIIVIDIARMSLALTRAYPQECGAIHAGFMFHGSALLCAVYGFY